MATTHTVKPLDYPYDSLEPYVEERTMRLHHDKHLAAYAAGLNALIEEYGLSNLPEDSMKLAAGIRFLAINGEDRNRFIFNAGGVANHEFFFAHLRKRPLMGLPEKLERSINANFGTFTNFQKLFTESALELLGPGWTWLCVSPNGKKARGSDSRELFICNTHIHDNPAMIDITLHHGHPILCIDMWEHAYYLKHQNRKADYIKEFWSVVDWEKVEENYLDGV